MKELHTREGDAVQVDDEDFDYLNQWQWKRGGYGRMVVRGTSRPNTPEEGPGRRSFAVYLHVEVAKRAGLWADGLRVDHRDRDILNNQRSNLRAATASQNACNQKIRRDNTSKYKGVSWDSKCQGWAAYIRVDGTRKFLGYYSEAVNAAAAYNNAAAEYHGKFAFVNDLPDSIDPCRVGVRRPRKNNSSGYRGVSWNKPSGCWQAMISVHKKRYWLGLFATKEEAALAYNQAALSHGVVAANPDGVE